jgi:ribonuclease HII
VELFGRNLDELRKRYSRPGAAIPERLLESLRADQRAGARKLADELEQRRDERAKERRRVGRLWKLEKQLAAEGHACIAGCDEVGMGPLAGPVIAAAVILPMGLSLVGLDDSKRLTSDQRERLAVEIRARALAFGLGAVSADEIDRINIYRAGHLAIRRALESLGATPDAVVVDGRRVPDIACHQVAVIGGDARVASIAAASVVAKVHRDALMRELDRVHPGYGFAQHMGYSTKQHFAALTRLGPSPIHRRSFAPVREATCRTR